MAVGPTARILRLAIPTVAMAAAGAIVLTVVSGPRPVALVPAETPSATVTVSLPPSTETLQAAQTRRQPPTPARLRVAPVLFEQPAVHARPGAHTALIVGVDDTDPKRPLVGARADATNLRDALLKYGFYGSDITVLIDGQATRARILTELRRLVARTPSDGLAVFAAASHGSGTSLRTADGARLYASELGRYLGQIRAPVWTALAVCYAGGFSVPGVVGPNRIATFSSDAKSLTYEIGTAGSELFYYMVGRGMLEARAPRSVESAFNYARSTLAKDHPSLPVMNDQIPGELVLGPVKWGPPEVQAPPPPTPAPDHPVATPAPDNPDASSGGSVLCGLLGCGN